jgi:zinc protease
MIRPSRLAAVASLAFAQAACTTLGSMTPHPGSSQMAEPKAPPPATPQPMAQKRLPQPMNVWPQTYADLPPDPAMRFGTLANGLRYVVMKNATPAGQSSLRLRINAGSIDETASQAGLAHFLEHMAFNGSTHVPEGEMIKILERHGLAFGADTNASTSWEETVYKLDLPKSDDDTVDTSLMLLREAAGELSLTQSAIDKEKGVVLSEERLRDTPGYRVLKRSLGFSLEGQLAADRFPIGQVKVIQNATRAQISDFYRQYYRPERAVLVAVGDFDADAMEAKIKARFGDWAGSGPAGTDPDLGAPLHRGSTVRLVVQPGAPQMVQFAWVSAPELAADSKAKRRRDTIEALGLAVLNRRLDRMVRAEDPPFISAGVYSATEFHSARVTTLQTTARGGEWRKALTAADLEARRLAQYGVSAAELGQEIDGYRASLKSAADGAATRTTPSVADDIASTLSTPEVETAPAEDLALFDEAVKGLTPAEVNTAIKAAFSGSGPLLLVATPTAIDGGEKAVSAALSAAQATPVTADAARAAVVWPYDSFGAPGEVAERTDVADLDTTFVRFQNGVRLTIKPTKFRTDQVLVKVRIGGGRKDLPQDHPTTAWAAPSAFPEGGLDQVSSQDLDEVLRSKIVGRQFAVDDDAFALQGVTRPDDLDIQLQLLAAYTAHPGWRPQAFTRMHGAAPTILDQLAATPSGVLSRDLAGLLHNGDPRWGLPSRADIAAQTPDQMKALLAPKLAGAPLEVVVVGDVNADKVVDAVAATFGALPSRPAYVAEADPTIGFPAPTPSPVVLTHTGRADQAIGMVAWPTDDFLSDTQKARTLVILGDVMELRLIEQLRRTEGATYSPSAGAQASDTFAHYGYLSARVEIPPAKLDGFFTDVTKIAGDLRTDLVSPDELQRAKAPAFESLEKRRQTNEYWLTALGGAQTDPRKLTAIRSSEAQLQRVSAEDIRRAARAFLADDKAWKLEVKPAKAP